eukprot:EG_transcript_9029
MALLPLSAYSGVAAILMVVVFIAVMATYEPGPVPMPPASSGSPSLPSPGCQGPICNGRPTSLETGGLATDAAAAGGTLHNVTLAPNLPPTQASGNHSLKRSFRSLFWGGPVSTYQKISDFDKTYECPGLDTHGCSLKSSFHDKGRDTTEFDAILFRAWFAPIVLNKYPVSRRPALQKWVLMIDEAPYISDNIRRLMLPPLLGLYNLTMGYHRSSHIPMYFGPSMDRIFDPPLPVQEKNQEAPVMWVAHNCIAFNNRHRYVEALMKHVNVHSFGDCLRNREWPDALAGTERRRNKDGHGRDHIMGKRGGIPKLASSGLEATLQRYKFYLSFENQNCEDYVSEKFFRALYSGTVPVVLGPPNIEEYKPAAKSVINAADFKTPKDLADYLNWLHHNDTAYNEYLAYKSDPALLLPSFKALAAAARMGRAHRGYSRSMTNLMCDLCHALQANGTQRTAMVSLLPTCTVHNYEADALCDDALHPVATPLPPALAALQEFQTKYGVPQFKRMPNSRDFLPKQTPHC